ncbi:MAG: preprotein translocase subunit SecE [Coriobacteriia bacterium]|nr:preprotein translocase subunit SecE [Coriobacteriia bacterium]
MAKKSKTQRAKASANRQAKKARAQEQEAVVQEETPKKRFFGSKDDKKSEKLQPYQEARKADSGKPSKAPNFLQQVRSEMRRVTWPTKRDVLQWSGVVIVALIFFGLFCVVLDDAVITPILFAISNLGA